MSQAAPPSEKPLTQAQQRKQQKSAEIAARKAEREAKRLQKEDEKRKRARQREEARQCREDARLARRRVKRLDLPDSFPDWDAAQDAESCLPLEGFTQLEDQGIFEQIRQALMEETTFAKAMVAIGNIFNCSRSEVCLVCERGISRLGVRQSIIRFQYPYNAAVIPIIKAAGDARFDSRRKAWHLAPREDSAAVLQDLAKHFVVMIDVDSMAVRVNSRADRMSSLQGVAFRPVPFHLEVKWSDILYAIRSARPGDKVEREAVFYHDGHAFQPLPETAWVWTRLPFLLLRYAVPNGRPRYVSYSTLGEVVEDVMFANDSKSTMRGIARYMDTIHYLQRLSSDSLGELISVQPEELISEASGDRDAYRGPFKAFSDTLEHMRSVCPDITPTPLCSDYTTLMCNELGADSHANSLIAYVIPSGQAADYHFAIEKFFTSAEKAGEFPVVFTREHVAEWAERPGGKLKFIQVVSHELGHWVVKQMEEHYALPPNNPEWGCHRPLWAIVTDLLGYAYTGKQLESSACEYHPFLQEDIEFAVAKAGIASLEATRHGISPAFDWEIEDIEHAAVVSLNCLIERLGDRQKAAS